jgi:BirA family transcriptional regulator, biotin operon repressor / biotin---[acetyl-CoA-carboxylase] ligase
VHILPSCHSTNQYIKELFIADRIHGNLYCALEQKEGRGQQGNKWESEPFKNLTFSFYLEPKQLLVQDQFRLNYFISVGILNFLKSIVPNPELITLKWPNDIYAGNYKIGGILIENQVKEIYVANSIIGVGLNINQKKFSVPRATSLSLLSDKEVDVKEALYVLVKFIDRAYQWFEQGRLDELKEVYLANLLGYRQLRSFYQVENQEVFEGEIVGVSDTGLLQLEIANEVVLFGLKEVQFIF